MTLTIDNLDYTSYLDADHPPKITRKLNEPSRMAFTLAAEGGDMVVPVSGGRVIVARDDGHKLFTGYLDATPEYEYLGWGAKGPGYQYAFTATSDEAVLDRKRLPRLPAFIARTAGACLRFIAEALVPGGFDLSEVENGPALPQFATSAALAWLKVWVVVPSLNRMTTLETSMGTAPAESLVLILRSQMLWDVSLRTP